MCKRGSSSLSSRQLQNVSDSHCVTTGLVSQLWSTASYHTRTLVSSSGAGIVTVLRPVPFPKCAEPTIQQYGLPIHTLCYTEQPTPHPQTPSQLLLGGSLSAISTLLSIFIIIHIIQYSRMKVSTQHGNCVEATPNMVIIYMSSEVQIVFSEHNIQNLYIYNLVEIGCNACVIGFSNGCPRIS